MEMTLSGSLFHTIILLNIAMVVVLTVLLFIKSRQYTSASFILFILLLWAVPVLGVLVVPVLMVTHRKQYQK